MRATLAPIEARPAERLGTPAAGRVGIHVDPEHREMVQPLGRYECRIVRDLDPTTRRQCIGQADAKPAGNMVVASPSEAQTGIPWTCPGLRSGRVGRHEHQAFEKTGHLRGGKPVVAVSSLFDHGDERGRCELSQMAACRLRGDAGRLRQLGGCERPAIHQSLQHCHPRRIADQSSDLRD
jgi:hypothetical protein